MLKGGDSGLAAIVPGKLDKSYLIEVVRHLDPDVKMPPDEDPLPPKQIELLANWVSEGAVGLLQFDDGKGALLASLRPDWRKLWFTLERLRLFNLPRWLHNVLNS